MGRLAALIVVVTVAAAGLLLWSQPWSSPPASGPGPAPSPPPEPRACSGVSLAADDDIQQAIDDNPEGTTFCLASGTYVIDDNIEPKDGTELVGAGMGETILHSEGANKVIDAEGSHDLALSHLDIADAHGSRACRPQCGAGLAGGTGVVVDSVAFYDNENHGIGGAEDLVVRNSVFHHNGSEGFTGCCSGGVKSGSRFRIENSEVYENIGIGIWCDAGCPGGMEVYNNEVRANSLGGIRYEVSEGGATIVGNIVTDNNTSNSAGGHGGIMIVASSNVEVRDNVLGGNRHAGIIVADTPRGSSTDVVVEGNELNGDDVRGL